MFVSYNADESSVSKNCVLIYMTVCHLWVWKTLCSDDSDLIGCLEDIYQSPRSWPCLPVNTSHLISAQNPCHMSSNTDSSNFAKYGPKHLNGREMGTFVVHLEYYKTHIPIKLCCYNKDTHCRIIH